MKNHLFLVCLLSTFSFDSYCIASESEPKNVWFECVIDSDCVKVDYECAGNVVNKKYERAANLFYGNLNAISNCFRPAPTQEMKKIPYKVFCEKKKCHSQGLSPKSPGFS